MNKVAAMPGPRRRRKKVASLHAEDLRPDFDVANEVGADPERYRGDEKVSLYKLPRFVRLSVRRVVTRQTETLNTGAVAGRCMEYGLDRLLALDATKSLLSQIERLESANLDEDDAVEIDRWSHSCEFDVRDTGHSGRMRWDFRTSKEIRDNLFWLADQIGISGSTLGAVALMAGLAEQSAVLPKHAEYMRAVVAELDSLIEHRARRLKRKLDEAEGSRE